MIKWRLYSYILAITCLALIADNFSYSLVLIPSKGHSSPTTTTFNNRNGFVKFLNYDDDDRTSSVEEVLGATSKKDDSKKKNILPEWGGNCTQKDWNKCSNLTLWKTSSYVNRKKPDLGFKTQELNCTIQPILCLKNGWSVTQCQLLCMKCNKEILRKYDKYVAHKGEC